ncbi:MAG: M28 family peptidase [Acidobacteriota bacterium]
MRKPFLAVLLAALVAAGVWAAGAADKPSSEALYEKACEAWDIGDYAAALRGFEALLKGTDSARFFERIALLTGELYEVRSLAPDGRNLRFSPDGRLAAYESGARPAQVVHVLDAADGFKPLAEIRGGSGVFSPSGREMAVLRTKDTPEMEQLRKDMAASEASSTDFTAIMNLRNRLSWLEAKTAEIVVRDIASGRETVLADGGLLKRAIVFSADGRELYFAGGREADMSSNDIYAVPVDAAAAPGPRALTSGPGYKVVPTAAPGGKYLIYTVTARSPFPRPPAAAGQARPAGPSMPPAGPGRGESRRFAILALADGSVRAFDGGFLAVSVDGAAALFAGKDGPDNTLVDLKLDGSWAQTAVKKTRESINSAAFSPDGQKIAFEMTWTRNTEIFVVGADGKGEARLSREIEDDRAPRFLGPTLVLAVKGEFRHSRAYLYDTAALTATRLFHNNTVRTLSMEYEWAPDPSGRRILISAQRNGDTMVSEQGVFLLDLDRKIGLAALRARVADQLASELALRAKGEALFRPIAAEVRAAVSGASTTRIYGYEEALFNFDSKHVTKPGNRKAAEYIFKAFESFGYKPELQEVPNRPVKTANVVAVLAGSRNPELYYVLSSHYDSNSQGPGADDNSSATAVLLETARLLAGKPLPASVIFAAFTGEESGFWGSRDFVRLVKEKKLRIMAGLNNDMIGWANDNRLDDTIRYTNAGLRDVLHAAAQGFSRLITYDTHYIKSTDSVPLYEAWGNVIGGLGSYPLLGNPYYHLPTDLLETVNHQLLTEASRYCTAALMLLASSPSPVRGLKAETTRSGTGAGEGTTTGAVDVSWTPNPEKGISHYIVAWGPQGKAAAGSRKVKEARTRIKGLKTGEEWAVTVRAVNARGLASWDESKIVVGVGGAPVK